MDYLRCENVRIKIDVIKKEIERLEVLKRRLPE